MKRNLFVRSFLAGNLLLGLASFADAHFLWLVAKPAADGQPAEAHLYFSESPEPDDPELLKRLGDISIVSIDAAGQAKTIGLTLGEDSLTAPLADAETLLVMQHTYGVFTRGETSFLLNYRGKTGPALRHKAWTYPTSDRLDLDLVPAEDGDKIKVRVLWQGKPAAGVPVVAVDPAGDDRELESDANGFVSVVKGEHGLYTFRAKQSVDEAGEANGKAYSASRFYTTLTLPVGVPEQPKLAGQPLAALPEPVTSFGGAVLGDELYVYGGHLGSAHSYHNLSQSNQLWKLSLDKPGDWQRVATGPRIQGLAMVAHGGKLYRIGGFSAKNPEGEDHDLWSQSDFVRFDPAAGEWHDLPPLPEPRSSHDAAVVGDTLYVVGGWRMAGPDDTVWHETAWSCDLSADQLEWKPIPNPPFQRRALSLAAFEGKLYCIGGMQESGGPTRAVAVYDPATQSWSEGPEVPGEKAIAGFGSAAFAVGGHLYVSTIEGTLLKLSGDKNNWTEVGQLERARFFHRMLPAGAARLLLVGGANMGVGKFEEVEILDVR
jgi:N-acetylneuraminic acid mutarotase